ncbi:LOW QUALITY PROTEIN: equilibrative nucleoside transporter 1-like [Leucoraja erinacea]|uniref:LOW QUALITY PROTEIN: equilibrative nucleoside transporter 1-like n=1 Tax=Leucoraja erinaceus TaxID=7782 RepID=UPI0024555169|nr:LOW QUALITY PROTEIN: equilibrative nucleoside transporter 1-like [Leucoraja erinacea]
MTKMREQEPVDRVRAVWLIFLILGLGTLLPWNFFMTGIQYFKFRLEGLDAPSAEPMANGTSGHNVSAFATENQLQRKFGNVMTLCAMLPMLIFSCLNSVLLPRVPQTLRISGSLVAIFILFLLTAILVKISMEPLTFFVVTMITIVFINSLGAVLQGTSFFGLAGLLPPAPTQPSLMSGQGLAVLCGGVLLALMGCYHCLPQLAFSRHHFKVKSEEWMKAQQEECLSKVDLIKQDGSSPSERPSTLHVETHCGERDEGPSVITILRKVWPLALQVWFVFTVTISIFPAVTVDAVSTVAGDGIWRLYFIPICCFLMFNLFDWFGRSLTAFCMWPRKGSKWLVALVITRVVFIPLFMLCNIYPRQLPVFFAHDAWYICFMVLFAFSNGYMASLCMCYGPQNVSPKEAEMAGAVMSFFLSLGLASGAFLGFLVRALV